MNTIVEFRAAVLMSLGHAPEHIEPGRLHRFPTRDASGDSAGWCRLFDDGRAGVFGDFRTGVSELWQAKVDDRLSPARRAELARQARVAQAGRELHQQLQWSKNRQRNAALLAQARPLAWNDSAAQYLRHRGFEQLWPLPSCLHFHPALPYWHDDSSSTVHPALLAPVIDARGEVVSIHRTYLTPAGRKARVPTPKKLTPASGYLGSAAIQLFAATDGRIGVAEGIETALGAHCASLLPVVAAVSASGLAAWRWPLSARRIVVFGDADDAGRDAAAKLRDRALQAGRACDVLIPSVEGADWCDVWVAAASEVTT